MFFSVGQRDLLIALGADLDKFDRGLFQSV